MMRDTSATAILVFLVDLSCENPGRLQTNPREFNTRPWLDFFSHRVYVTPPGCGMPKSPLGRLLSKTSVDPIGREGLELAFAGSGSDRSLT